MKYITLFVGAEYSCGCYVDTDICIDNAVFIYDLIVKEDVHSIPSKIYCLQDGTYSICPTFSQQATAQFCKDIVVHSLEMMRQEERSLLVSFLKLFYGSILENNPMCQNCEIYLCCEYAEQLNSHEQDELVRFIREACGITLKDVIHTSCVGYYPKYHVQGILRKDNGNSLIIDYSKQTLNYYSSDGEFRISGNFPIGIADIVPMLYEYILKSDASNEDSLQILCDCLGSTTKAQKCIYDELLKQLIYWLIYEYDRLTISIDISHLLLDKKHRGHYFECEDLFINQIKSIISPHIVSLLDYFKEIKEHAGEIASVFLIGSSSKIFYIRDLVSLIFGCEPYILLEDRELIYAESAAICVYESFLKNRVDFNDAAKKQLYSILKSIKSKEN